MKLRSKFLAFVLACVSLSVVSTVSVLSTDLAREHRRYQMQVHRTLVDFSVNQLELQMNVLYAEWGPQTYESNQQLADVLKRTHGVLGLEVWEGKRRVHSILPSGLRIDSVPEAFPAGERWRIRGLSGPGLESHAAYLWEASVPPRTVVLVLEKSWVLEPLAITDESAMALIAPDGSVIASKLGKTATPDLIAPNAPARKGFDRVSNPLPSSPRLQLLSVAPEISSATTLGAVYGRALWIGLASLALAMTLAWGFSLNLARPLQRLSRRVARVATDPDSVELDLSSQRRDEIGELARAFNRMLADLRQSRNELRRSERLAVLGKFSAAIAHEVKNPLAGILANTQLSRRRLTARTLDAEAIDAIQSSLGFVEEETKRTNAIVSRLVKFSRHDTSHFQPFDVLARVRRSLEMIQPWVDQEGAHLTTSIPEGELTINGDADQLHEVLLNLVKNAIDATKNKKDRRVAIHAGREGDWIMIRVRDNGDGVPETIRTQIFEPFFTTKGVGEGSGLGLAVCHGIISAHGGSIEVAGSGETEFVVRLPVVTAARSAA